MKRKIQVDIRFISFRATQLYEENHILKQKLSTDILSLRCDVRGQISFFFNLLNFLFH